MNSKNNREDIKIVFGAPKFIVNEKAKIVICKLGFRAVMPKALQEIIYWKNYETTPEFTRTSKAIAFTKENDVFNVNIGKKVALAKAENQAYNYVNNHMLNALNEIIKCTKAIGNFNNKTERVINHNIEYMKKF